METRTPHQRQVTIRSWACSSPTWRQLTRRWLDMQSRILQHPATLLLPRLCSSSLFLVRRQLPLPLDPYPPTPLQPSAQKSWSTTIQHGSAQASSTSPRLTQPLPIPRMLQPADPSRHRCRPRSCRGRHSDHQGTGGSTCSWRQIKSQFSMKPRRCAAARFSLRELQSQASMASESCRHHVPTVVLHAVSGIDGRVGFFRPAWVGPGH